MVMLEKMRKTLKTSIEFRDKEGKANLEFCTAINMTVGNTLLKKRASHPGTYKFGSSKTQVNRISENSCC